MKLSAVVFLGLAQAQTDEKVVPEKHPRQRLHRLNDFTDEILDQYFSFLPSQAAWKAKFVANSERMYASFQKCGFFNREEVNGQFVLGGDTPQEPHGGDNLDGTENDETNQHAASFDEIGLGGQKEHITYQGGKNNPGGSGKSRRSIDDMDVDRYNREDPCVGVRQIGTGYRKWAIRYLGRCGQQSEDKEKNGVVVGGNHVRRMGKWIYLLQRHLRCDHIEHARVPYPISWQDVPEGDHLYSHDVKWEDRQHQCDETYTPQEVDDDLYQKRSP
jgi:hypothetical protein